MNNENIRVKIIVATHKKYHMPENFIYLPLHVGAEGKVDSEGNILNLGYIKDNTGDNISILNPNFCELTGLYWAWKNMDEDYIGLVHYRRYFSSRRGKSSFDNILTYDDLKPYLGKIKIFVPKKRRYYIESLYSHYAHTHYSQHLDETKIIIQEKYPEYIEDYNKVLNQTYGYMFNMMIIERDLLGEYCTWLFDILFELKNKMDMPNLSAFQDRFYGRVAEILFNVWVSHEVSSGKIKKKEIKEIPYMMMEKVNWFKKGNAFLRAKYLGVKYKQSF